MFRTLATLCVLAHPAAAQDLIMQFQDGAPKDSITLANTGCPLTDAVVTLDLSETDAGLIFDVTSDGVGVEVFQPVEVTQGNVTVSDVTDGSQLLTLSIPELPEFAEVRLTADLDDTMAGRQTVVVGSELAGANMVLYWQGEVATAAFQGDGIARIDLSQFASACPVS